MKYENARRVAGMMGEALASRFAPPDADFLAPVPLHKSSERDYNQAEIMAMGAGKVWCLDTVRALEWKIRFSRQALKSGRERAPLPEDAMTATVALDGVRVFLVDDVYTSGGTMRAAARAVEAAGAAVTGAMVWSRAGGGKNGRAEF
jgi:predicted amidophosphoribosyltransferase